MQTKTWVAFLTVLLLTHYSHGNKVYAAGQQSGKVDRTVANIVEIDKSGNRVKIAHGELKNLGMRPMSMFFGVTGNLDLSGFATDDLIEVEIKRGRDGTHRIMAMCKIAIEGEPCL